jgi:putative transposase
MEETINGEEEAYSGRDRCEAATGRCVDRAGPAGCRRGPFDRRDGSYYRWRNEYGNLKGDQVKRLKELEIENNRLRRAVSDLTLDKLILSEAAKKNF